MRTTRRQFLQRMAAGGSLLAVPGLVAACGGGGIEGDDEGSSAAAPAATSGGATSAAATTGAAPESSAVSSAASTGTLAENLRISNWTLYIDIDEETNQRPSLDDFTKEFGVKVDYFEDINSNEEFFGKVQAPLSQGAEHRPRHRHPHRLHGRALRGARLHREARPLGDPQRRQPAAGPAEPDLGSQPRLEPGLAVRHDRHRATTPRRSARRSPPSTT